MPQVFISYSRDERAVAEELAAMLTDEGYDVWWDASLLSGARFEDEINAALKSAPAAIILWSKTAVQSEWVRAEAEIARRLRSALPAVIDDLDHDQLPMLYQQLHVIDMKGWIGNEKAKGYRELLGAVARRLRQTPKSAVRGPERTADPVELTTASDPVGTLPRPNWWPAAGAGGAVLTAIVAVVLFAISRQMPLDSGPIFDGGPSSSSSESLSFEMPSSGPPVLFSELPSVSSSLYDGFFPRSTSRSSLPIRLCAQSRSLPSSGGLLPFAWDQAGAYPF